MLKLPIRAQQEVKSYTQFALPLCVIFTEKNYHSWILSNFMEIKSSKVISKNGNHLQYSINNGQGNDLMEVDYGAVLDVSENVWSEIENHVDFVKSSISEGMYVHHQLDEFFMQAKLSYQKSNFLHPSLIYGFCDQKKEFYAVGFSDVEFKEFIITYDEMLLATTGPINHNSFESSNSHKERKSYSYRLKSASGRFPFSLTDLKNNLEKYLMAPEIDGWIYGLGGYELVLNNLIDPYKPGCYLKYNTTHFLYEHKKIFNLALNYIFCQYELKDKFIDLYDGHKKIVNLFERVRVAHMESIIEEEKDLFISTEKVAKNIYSSIKEIYDMERNVVEGIHEKICILSG